VGVHGGEFGKIHCVVDLLLALFKSALALPQSLLMAVILWLGSRYRPFWRWFLKMVVKLKIKPKGMPAIPLLLLAFDRVDVWQDVVLIVDELHTPIERMEMASAFSTLYLREKRLAESLEAARYWARIPEEWVQNHPDEADKTLKWYRSQAMWYPYGFPHLVPANVERMQLINATKRLKAEFKNNPTLSKERIEMMSQWRDSRLMNEVLNWIIPRAESGKIEWPPTEKISVFSLMPLGFESVNDFRILVVRFHIPRSTFNSMWRRATKLDS